MRLFSRSIRRRLVASYVALTLLTVGATGLLALTLIGRYATQQQTTFLTANAEAVARHIPDDASLFINIGTTTEEVARALLRHRGLRIITNNLHVASIMSQNEGFEVIVAGGVVRSRDRGIVGETTIDFLGQFKVDFGIIGISGIDADGALLDFDHREIRASKCIIANSRQVFLVADHSKFGRNAMARLGNLRDLDAFFTDHMPPLAICELLAESDVRLHVAGESEGAAKEPQPVAAVAASARR